MLGNEIKLALGNLKKFIEPDFGIMFLLKKEHQVSDDPRDYVERPHLVLCEAHKVSINKHDDFITTKMDNEIFPTIQKSVKITDFCEHICVDLFNEANPDDYIWVGFTIENDVSADLATISTPVPDFDSLFDVDLNSYLE